MSGSGDGRSEEVAKIADFRVSGVCGFWVFGFCGSEDGGVVAAVVVNYLEGFMYRKLCLRFLLVQSDNEKTCQLRTYAQRQ